MVSRVCYGRDCPYPYGHPWALLLPVCFIESVVAKPLTVATSPRRSRQAALWYCTSTAPAVFHPSLSHCLGLSSCWCQPALSLRSPAIFRITVYRLLEPRSRPDRCCVLGCYPHTSIAGLPQLDIDYLFTLDVPRISQLNFRAHLTNFTRGKVVKSSRYDCVSVSVFAGITALAPSCYIFARSHGSRGLIGLSCQAQLQARGRDPSHYQRVAVLSDVVILPPYGFSPSQPAIHRADVTHFRASPSGGFSPPFISTRSLPHFLSSAVSCSHTFIHLS